MTKYKHKYEPDYAVAPGATLKEAIDERGMSQQLLAVRLGMAEKTISQIVNGIAPITCGTAEKLELVLGIPASYWNRRELAYRESLARVAAVEQLKADIAWLKEVPVKELRERKLIDADSKKEGLVREVLQFFGVGSVDAWRDAWGNVAVQFRSQKAHEKKPGFVAAWLRIGEIQSAAIKTPPFDPDEFRRALHDVRRMTTMNINEWRGKLQERCAAAGVAVVLTPEFPGAAVSGATRWIGGKAVIQLSLKFKTNDQIWFSFFHEAGHILLHGQRGRFLEFGSTNDTQEERQANEFAQNILIPPEMASRLPRLKTRSQVQEFASQIGIDAGIVAGRLLRDGYLHAAKVQAMGLRRRFAWGNRS